MLSGLYRAFAQLTDPRLRRILGLGVVVAVGCWIGLALAAHWLIQRTRLFDADWADSGAGAALGVAAFLVPLLFFSATATFIMSFWLDEVCEVVEARHYPGLGPTRHLPWPQVLLASLRFLLVMVTVTCVAAPVYLALLLFGLGVIMNYAVNGYLLGREYFELVASRRLDQDAARLLFRNHLGRLWVCGAIINLLFQIPLLNLTAPVVAAAFMTHVVQGLSRGPARL